MRIFKVDELVQRNPDHMVGAWNHKRIGVVLAGPSPFRYMVQWGDELREEYGHHLIPHVPSTPPKRNPSVLEFRRVAHEELVADLKSRLANAF